MRFGFAGQTSKRLRSNPKQGIGFEEAQEIFEHPYYLDQRSDIPEQYRAIGWVRERLYALIFEMREDHDGELRVTRHDQNDSMDSRTCAIFRDASNQDVVVFLYPRFIALTA